jgi:nucleoside-triphosphatase
MNVSKPKILLTGRPGIGKTTIVKKVIDTARDRAGGFYTEEIRKGGKREGFLVRALRGKSGVLAHVNHRGPCRVGRYGVDVDLFESIAISCLERALSRRDLIIIDEIGKMELFSSKFRQVVKRVLESNRMVLAVISQSNDAFTRGIREQPNVEQWTVTPKNRDTLASRILERLNLPGKTENLQQ